MSDQVILYDEVERVRPLELLLLGAIPALLGSAMVLGMVAMVADPRRRTVGAPIGMGIAATLLLGVVALLVLMRLSFWITTQGVFVRYFPFHGAPLGFQWSHIAAACVRRYDPVGEFYGWGLKRGPGGMSYTVDGTWGLDLTLKTGDHVLIGTRDPEAVRHALERLRTSRLER